MLAVVTYVKKIHSYLAPRRFVLRVDNQALSWLKTYSMDLGMVGRWIMYLDQYDMEIEHRPRTRHTNADGLSKRTNLYVMKEQNLKDEPRVKEGFNFLDQEVYDALPMLTTVDKQRRTIEPEVAPKMEVIRRKKPDGHVQRSEKGPGTKSQEPGETHERGSRGRQSWRTPELVAEVGQDNDEDKIAEAPNRTEVPERRSRG